MVITEDRYRGQKSESKSGKDQVMQGIQKTGVITRQANETMAWHLLSQRVHNLTTSE